MSRRFEFSCPMSSHKQPPFAALCLAALQMRSCHGDRVREVVEVFARKRDLEAFEGQNRMPAGIGLSPRDLALREQLATALRPALMKRIALVFHSGSLSKLATLST